MGNSELSDTDFYENAAMVTIEEDLKASEKDSCSVHDSSLLVSILSNAKSSCSGGQEKVATNRYHREAGDTLPDLPPPYFNLGVIRNEEELRRKERAKNKRMLISLGAAIVVFLLTVLLVSWQVGSSSSSKNEGERKTDVKDGNSQKDKVKKESTLKTKENPNNVNGNSNFPGNFGSGRTYNNFGGSEGGGGGGGGGGSSYRGDKSEASYRSGRYNNQSSLGNNILRKTNDKPKNNGPTELVDCKTVQAGWDSLAEWPLLPTILEHAPNHKILLDWNRYDRCQVSGPYRIPDAIIVSQSNLHLPQNLGPVETRVETDTSLGNDAMIRVVSERVDTAGSALQITFDLDIINPLIYVLDEENKLPETISKRLQFSRRQKISLEGTLTGSNLEGTLSILKNCWDLVGKIVLDDPSGLDLGILMANGSLMSPTATFPNPGITIPNTNIEPKIILRHFWERHCYKLHNWLDTSASWPLTIFNPLSPSFAFGRFENVQNIVNVSSVQAPIVPSLSNPAQIPSAIPEEVSMKDLLDPAGMSPAMMSEMYIILIASHQETEQVSWNDALRLKANYLQWKIENSKTKREEEAISAIFDACMAYFNERIIPRITSAANVNHNSNDTTSTKLIIPQYSPESNFTQTTLQIRHLPFNRGQRIPPGIT